MPVYTYQHTETPGAQCSEVFEQAHAISKRLDRCPRCDGPVKKLVSSFSTYRNVLSSSNIKEKGFTKLVRRDKGVYEKE